MRAYLRAGWVRVRVRVQIWVRVRVRIQILSLGRATGWLVGGFEGAGATAQEEGKRAGPWLWQGWPCGAAAGEGGRRVNRLERTASRAAAATGWPPPG